ncbi:MAG: PAS domain S-box protein [Endomicrobiales bacterium]
MSEPLRVLIVDDSQDDTLLLQQVLMKISGGAVFTRVDSEEGMKAALSGADWDLVVADCAIPHFGGRAALGLLKSMKADVPFIVVAEAAAEEFAAEMTRAGASDYVMRDHLSRLVPSVERELREARARKCLKDFEDLLRQSEEKYETLFAMVQEGVWMIDRDMRTVLVNRHAADMLGYSFEEMMHVSLSAFIRAEQRPAAQARLDSLRKGVSVRFDAEFVRRDKSYLFTIVTLTPLMVPGGTFNGALGVICDITERRTAEREANRNLRFLQDLIDAMPLPVFYKDRRGAFIGCNRSFEKLTGMKKDQLIGSTAREAAPAGIVERDLDEDERILAGRSSVSYELALKDSDGASRAVIVNKAIFLNHDGTVGGLIGTISDITDRKRAEKEREAMQLQLLQSGKMAALGHLAAGVAHELNNPLTIIIGDSQYLREDESFGEAVKDIASGIDEAAQRCKKIISDMLEFSRGREIDLSDCPVHDVLDHALRLASYLAEFKKATVERRYDPLLPLIKASKSRLEQVFLNVINNAVQAMPEGGTLSISTRIKDANTVEIAFSDTGAGILPENLQKVFDPFFSTKPKGTGLGLPVSYNIIRQHGGDVRVSSRGPGSGATFTITLPVNSIAK